ncbi:ferritin family protein [Clostridium sp. CX1]|uniref:Ferritin family protein n=1 Tax=Clostridium tanneri TaxID=3037988 RepID=A0ABU4JU81_9CLOT|nr:MULTISPECIES: ferritin family protein [unclassified Clostridium]MCT8977088.1 ferritin family protein [Clostridium sp. CX1]MDW8801707.1 ferritin family protein [Clostridium sp. A1-XYC3]
MNKLICVVCGMEINDKNYDFNKEGFITSNHIDNIDTCPFCGANKEYLVQGGKAIEFGDSGKLDSTTLKIIDHAVKLEIFNGDFYKKASKIAKDEKVKKVFEALSRIEYMHARIHKKIGGFTEDPVLREMDYSKYNSDEILLEMACKREKHAVEYYEKYSSVVEDKNIKSIFKALSMVEEEHIQLTDKGQTL